MYVPYARHYNPLLNTNHTYGQRSQYINEFQEVGTVDIHMDMDYFSKFYFFFFFRTVWDDNCTETQIVELIPTDLRLNKYYIIGYVNWVWTLTTVLIPFFALLFLTISIFTGLRRVRKNLNRHKRLEGRAARVVANVRKGTEPSCTIQVRVTNENGVGKCLPFIFFLNSQHKDSK